MSRQDEITGKRAQSGNLRSHALNTTKRKFNLNLQKVTIMEDGKKRKVKVSAKTAKTLKRQGKIA
ncbi:MAG: 50S ribosomal protein L28 [Mycoplasmataceae bacterium]|nr:50S ribosomal protein L28 [Mycoplasmataceae bacterium]